MNKIFVKIIILFALIVDVNSQLLAQFTREDTIIENKIYRPYSNYLLLSVGKSYNIENGEVETAGSVGFVFRIIDQFFQAGYHMSSDQFFLNRSYQKLNDIFIMYGFRQDLLKRNMDVFFGVSYAYGSTYWETDSLNKRWYKGFSTIGIRVSADYEWKLFYDIGIGLNGYAEWNSYYPIVGIKINVYFSGAYRGEIK